MHEKIQHYFDSLNWELEPKQLYDPIAYTLASGGKRIRPQLTLMGCALFGCEIEKALPAAAALEIFHNFTLLHDDVMDNADTRRGRATVHKKWDVNTAILSGDGMLIKAYQLLEQIPNDKLPDALHLFSKTALEVCEGQQYDMNFESISNVSLDEYFKMIRLKTAVLLGASLKMGAIIAGAWPENAQHLYNYGIAIGIAFQLRDDYLDVYGDATTFGKAIGGDILCGKKTFLLIQALNHSTPTQKEYLRNLLSNTTIDPQEKIAEVTNLYNQMDIPQLCQTAMEGYYNQALAELEAIEGVRQESKEPFVALARKLMGRND